MTYVTVGEDRRAQYAVEGNTTLMRVRIIKNERILAAKEIK